MTDGVVLAKLRVEDEERMHRLGLALADLLKAGDLVILDGPLGAGKTTLTRAVGEGLRVTGTVASPTFVIARTHKRMVSGEPVLVHVDAYRLNSVGEFDDLDIDFDRSIVFVEWGRGFADELADSWLDIQISRDHTGESETREVIFTGFGVRFTNHDAQGRFAHLADDGGAR